MEGNDKVADHQSADAADVQDRCALNEVFVDTFVKLRVDEDAETYGEVSDGKNLKDLSV